MTDSASTKIVDGLHPTLPEWVALFYWHMKQRGEYLDRNMESDAFEHLKRAVQIHDIYCPDGNGWRLPDDGGV